VNRICFERGLIDELWLFGDRISEGMFGEIKLALQLKIPIIAKSWETQMALRELTKKEYDFLQ
ncbi:MAG: hypothetical protein Q7S34_01500, partial [bacterium]|nr:hypothetical protein [bacterium]